MSEQNKGKNIRVKPSDINFSQASIENRFEDGELIGKRLDDLVYECKEISSIRNIRVVDLRGKWYTPDNRRLWLFRNYQKIKRQSYQTIDIPVIVWDDFETETQLVFSAKSDGHEVEIHGGLPGGETYKKVDNIHPSTYWNGKVLLLYDISSWTYNGIRAVTSFVWGGIRNAVTRLY